MYSIPPSKNLIFTMKGDNCKFQPPAVKVNLNTSPNTNMPYVLISTQIRLECGPTVVGDEWSDPKLMEYLGASLLKALGNNFMEYRTPDPSRKVLNKLEKRGYKVVAMTGVGQTCIWTLHKPDDEPSETIDFEPVQ